jgi:hypothetical protein
MTKIIRILLGIPFGICLAVGVPIVGLVDLATGFAADHRSVGPRM